MATIFRFIFWSAILKRITLTSLIFIAFIIYLFYLGWSNFGPQKAVLNYERQAIANTAIQKMQREISQNRKNIRSAILLHFTNDSTDYFFNTLRYELNTSGVLDLKDASLGEKIKLKLNMRIKGPETLQEALEYSDDDVQGILWGEIHRFESFSTGTVLQGEWFLIDSKSRTIVYTGKIDEKTIPQQQLDLALSVPVQNKDIAHTEYTDNMIPWHMRFFGYILIVLLLPIVTISFIRVMVAKKSNKINAFLLGTYTILDAILAFFMIGGCFTVLSTVFFCIALVCAFFYNVYLMTFALKLES